MTARTGLIDTIRKLAQSSARGFSSDAPTLRTYATPRGVERALRALYAKGEIVALRVGRRSVYFGRVEWRDAMAREIAERQPPVAVPSHAATPKPVGEAVVPAGVRITHGPNFVPRLQPVEAPCVPRLYWGAHRVR